MVHLPPGPEDQGEAGRSGRRNGSADAGSHLGLPGQGAADEPDAEAVLAEINGWDAHGQPLASYEQLNDDGSTACGCWIYCGVYADGVNQAARRKPGGEQNWVASEWGWAWPANRRILYNRASADPDGKPWSERKALVWWDEDQATWTGHDIADFTADKSPHYRPPDDATGAEALSGADAFVMQADGKAWLFAPAGLVDGPLPAHYEPQDSPFRNLLYASSATRSGRSTCSGTRTTGCSPAATTRAPRCSPTSPPPTASPSTTPPAG